MRNCKRKDICKRSKLCKGCPRSISKDNNDNKDLDIIKKEIKDKQ